MILSSNVPKKRNLKFLFGLGPNAMKQLWSNADTQMFCAFSSIKANLHSKSFVFRLMHLCYICTKYLVLLQELFLYLNGMLELT